MAYYRTSNFVKELGLLDTNSVEFFLLSSDYMSVTDFLDEATRFVNLKDFYLDLEKIPKPKISFYVASKWSILGLWEWDSCPW